MKEYEVRVIFQQESLDTKDVESSLMVSIIESFAQAENDHEVIISSGASVKEQQKARQNCMSVSVMDMKMMLMVN